MRKKNKKLKKEKKILKAKKKDQKIKSKKNIINKIPEVKKDARSVELLRKRKSKSYSKKLTRRQKQKYDLAFIREVTRVTRQMKSNLKEDRKCLRNNQFGVLHT